MKYIFIILLNVILTSTLHAQAWMVESEDYSSVVTYGKNGEIDIYAPKGLTLWYKKKMEGNTTIEYEACIVTGGQLTKDIPERLSDLNCFWMASEPNGTSVLKHAHQRHGKFVNQYALQLYYMGYGGNYNSTTRFRRYNGDMRGVDSAKYRPQILKEYTDTAHLLRPNQWYKIRLEQINGRVRYFIDGKCLVDYIDPSPLKSGHFGFRTTLAHAKLRNFNYKCQDPDAAPITLKKVSGQNGPVTFGVPFSKGEKTDQDFTLKNKRGEIMPYDTWTLAKWQDGSIKWQAFATHSNNDDTIKIYKNKSPKTEDIQEAANIPPFYITINGETVPIDNEKVEYRGKYRTIRKYIGKNYIVRAYTYNGSKQIKLVHTLLVDSTLNAEGLKELSIHFRIPMHGKDYERYVNFGNKHFDVQPLIARRKIDLVKMDSVTQSMIQNIAKWDGFRLSQLSPNAYSIRKRTTSISPWIGTIEGFRSDGKMTIGDNTTATTFYLKDFWQSYPSTLQVDGMRHDTATITISLWSKEAEAFSFAHYDTIAHTLEAAYEDVQPGMSTALGIARTSTIYINNDSQSCDDEPQFVCTPEYLHRKRAFGVWSLPTKESLRDSIIENSLAHIMDFYKTEIKRNNWYGFWNYGDVMHAYDNSRDEWRYDVGGYAWDNTELGTPTMFWYQFLRTGDSDLWKMAEAMTRHCSEVDTYHFGQNAGLGSRHNVSHWGCGAKEARISEAWWNRFYYYLTADERIGDIMHEVTDADTLLYTIDPMRLAQPRGLFPCTAPARLRIGPDWLAYVSNWMTEWERTGNIKYKNKIIAGMKSIANLPHGIFTGPMALGYYPATGIITSEADTTVLSTNHLITIMGGFEMINELEPMIECPEFYETWAQHAAQYQSMALKIRKNKFLVPRLTAYGAWRLGDTSLQSKAWNDLLNHIPLRNRTTIWTNDCATWTLDAIFMKEVLQ